MSELRTVLSADAGSVDSEGLGLGVAELQRLYEAMVTTRAVDQHARRLHDDSEIGFYVASYGLEAVSAGAALCLEPADWLFPSHRDLGMYLLRGGSIRSWFDQLFGNAADPAKGRQLPGHATLEGGRYVSISGRVGVQLTHAAGCAMAIKARHDEACALASFGEAAAGADFHAAMTIAGRFRAPAIFVCRSARRETGAELGTSGSLAERARAYGLAAERVDGTDVLAVYGAVAEARRTAVQGGGATLIETAVERRRLLGDAPVDEPDAADDPVTRLRRFLEDSGHWDAAREEQLDARLRARVEEAAGAAREHERPAIGPLLFDDVYEQPPWVLQEQRERLLGEHAE